MKPFLLDQSFSRLDSALTAAELQRHVCGHIGDEQQSRGREARSEPWETIDRSAPVEMVTNAAKNRRVAIACDAGLGKTTNMQWLQSCVARAAACEQLPLLLRLDDAEKKGETSTPHLVLVQKEADDPGSLLDWWAGRISHRTGCDLFQLKDHLKLLQRQGGITLLIDGLDHALAHEHFAEVLRTVLTSDYWGNCPIWLAGRPYAFESCWDSLFADIDWRYLRVNPLGKPEIRQYLQEVAGVDVYEELIHAHDLLAVPRLLQLICGIIRGKLPIHATDDEKRAVVQTLNLRTAADVYHHAYFDEGENGKPDTYGLLRQGLVGDAERIGLDDDEMPSEMNVGDRISRIADLAGAIAFVLMGGRSKDGDPEPNAAGVPRDELRRELHGRREHYGLGGKGKFDRDLNLLGQMNNFTLDYLLFRDAGGKRWVFHDRTALAFFAAHWAMKRGTPTDQALIRQWIVGPSDKQLSGYDEFWQFAAEMPEPLADKTRWLAMFCPSYEHPHRLRGSETVIQWHRRAIYLSHRNMEAWEPGTIVAWRKESASLAAELEAGWRRCPSDESLTRPQEFLMGSPKTEEERYIDEAQRLVRVLPFRLQEFVVTNAQYERFDRTHRREKKVSDQDNQPVVKVTFWDAWCFAYWVGHRLPTEAEWEYACRAGTTTRYNFGDEIDSSKCNYGGSLGRTTILGTYEQPNEWGLFDMHGNVYEWCDSRYTSGASARVLRGGSWDDIGRSCRSAFRNGDEPEDRSRSYGFRLAAVPVVGAKSGKS